MSKTEKCECCGEMFDRNEVVNRFDEEYGIGTYDHLYSMNDFCYDCAEEIMNEDSKSGINVYEAADIWASNGKDEDYMFGYTEQELEDAFNS